MDQRKQQLLQHIIEGYLSTAQPVGSKYIASKRSISLSPATIRNEMSHLESEGFITHPHTSAGRVPTIKGLEYYIEELLKPTVLSKNEVNRLHKIFEQDGLKGLARESANLCKSACIIVQNDSDFYYTGFSQLFSETEYADASLVHAISAAIDQFEAVLPEFTANGSFHVPKIFIGPRNPLGNDCSVTFVGNKSDKIHMGLLSPIRTNYNKNVGLLQTIAVYL